MEKPFIIILIAISGIIIFLLILNISTLVKVTRLTKSNEKRTIADERYHELNNKFQLLTVVSSILLLIGGFLGYDSINSINENYEKQINNYKKQIEKDSTIVDNYRVILGELDNFKESINDSLNLNYEEIKDIKEKLRELQNDYRLNAKTYFIKEIKIPEDLIKDNRIIKRVYFKELKTLNNKIPSKFKDVPYVSIIELGEGFITIKKITQEYFEYAFSGTIELTDQELIELLKKAKPDGFLPPNELDADRFDLIIIEGGR
ncbi:MAG: hypothetical protein K9H49_14540 [Bacteroidales bacterium]|nr:hypothetical protein [Bacteroidales bacterium]MCF8406214.1 hypothetical protein [Bacteroidales bacterium]